MEGCAIWPHKSTSVISGRFPRVYMADLEEALIATLRSCGIEKLKEKQSEAVLAFVNGQDVFVSLPTGYGKSIIYGILPILFDNWKGMVKYK